MKMNLRKLTLGLLVGLMVLVAVGCDVIPASRDLFTQSETVNFRNMMPGDSRQLEITATNTLTEYDYVDVYMRAVLHDEEGNPIYQEDVKAVEKSVAEMNDFLNQLTMTVDNVKDGTTTRIFSGTPGETDGLTNNVKLGSYRQGESGKLVVNLQVPLTLGNEYANRAGEVDWIFTLEGKMDDRTIAVEKVWNDRRNSKDRPDSVEVILYQDGNEYARLLLSEENEWKGEFTALPYEDEQTSTPYKYEVKEVVPEKYRATYRTEGNKVTITNTRKGLIQTGQLNWPVYAFGGMGLCVLVAGVILLKKRKNEHAEA